MKLPSIDQWRRAPLGVRLQIIFIIWHETHARLFSLPVSLAVRAGLFMFIILTAMPLHPLSPIIASGGGLSFALILWRVK